MRKLKTAAFLSYLTVGFNIASGILYTPWMIHSIGSGAYGLYTAALSFVSIFMMDFGIGAAVSKFLCKLYDAGDEAGAKEFIIKSYKLFVYITGVIALTLIAIYFFLDQIYLTFSDDELQTFKVLYIIIATYSIFSFPFTPQNGILIAKEKFVALKLCGLLNRVLIVCLIIVSIISGLGVYALVASNAVVNLLFVVIKFLILKKDKPISNDVLVSDNKVTYKQIFSFSIWVTITQISLRFIFGIMPTILGATSGSFEIALFGLASTFEGYVFTIAESTNGLLLPKVTRIINQDNSSEKLTEIMIKMGRLQLLILGLILIEFIIVGDLFIETWVGNQYYPTYLCTIFLLLPGLFDHPLQTGRIAVIASDKVKQQAIIYGSMAFINVLLSLILTNYLGAIGAALSIMVAYLYKSTAMVYLYKQLGFKMKEFFTKTYLPYVPIFISVMLFGVLLNIVITGAGYILIVGKASAIGVVYFVLSYLFFTNDFERNLIWGGKRK